MFPSSGLFSDVSCPLTTRGLCQRPHCSYKHGVEASSVDLTGVLTGCLYGVCGSALSDESSFHELVQINKEIETVRHEVEQERRRLWSYQTIQANDVDNAPAGKDVDRGDPGLPTRTTVRKKQAQAGKYVVDSSKPRTDLEYDPLSNFSAGSLSINSSGKERKARSRQSVKTAACERKQTVICKAQPSHLPFPDPHEDDDEDSVLVIDVSPSPDMNGSPAEKRAAKSSQDVVREEKEVKTVPTKLDSSKSETPTLSYSFDLKLDKTQIYNDDCDVGDGDQSPTNEEKECENTVVEKTIDLTGCLEILQRECDKMGSVQPGKPAVEKLLEPTNHSAEPDGGNGNIPQCEPPISAEKMTPMQQPNNSLIDPPEKSPQRRHRKQEQPARAQSLVQLGLKAGSVTGQTPGRVTIRHDSSEAEARQVERASCRSPTQALLVASPSANTHSTSEAETSEQFYAKDVKANIIIISSEEEDEEVNYSDIELSESDPEEECYRIFMEAKEEEQRNKVLKDQPDASSTVGAADVVEPEVKVTPLVQAGKKRVAHEATHAEQPVAKSRPQPQVLVPFRGGPASGFDPWPTHTSRTQEVQQRASVLTASLKGGQAFVSSVCKKSEPQSTASVLTPHPQTAPTILPILSSTAYVNYLPIAQTVVSMGSNLQLIVPRSSLHLPVTSVLTPISHVQTGTFRAYQAPGGRTASPVLIPALARKPSQSSVGASTSLYSSPAASATPQTAPKSMPVKRKPKQTYEASKDKVPHNIRQRYVNMFTEEFLKTTSDVNEAFKKAVAEEKIVYNRSINKVKYQSVAVNALKKLKNQNAAATKNNNEENCQRLKGNIPLNLQMLDRNDDVALYECLKEYVLSEERLIESNYPIQHPEKRGSAVLLTDNKKATADPLKRICCRCGATYSVNREGKHVRKEECTYHYGKGLTKRVPGGVETRYSCCEGVMGAPGCQVFQLHVHDALSLDGFVSTSPRSEAGCPGVFSLDCEMCYTVQGLELSRVTVVKSDLQVVYDTFIRPDSAVIDYNTRFSGVGEENLEGTCTSLREVQAALLSFVSAETILIGHGLGTDLCLLKLLHGMVVDTSVVFPHRLGPPYVLSLNNLMADHLRKIIQQSVCGHDTAEDAVACMELMLWKVKEDGKMKK